MPAQKPNLPVIEEVEYSEREEGVSIRAITADGVRYSTIEKSYEVLSQASPVCHEGLYELVDPSEKKSCAFVRNKNKGILSRLFWFASPLSASADEASNNIYNREPEHPFLASPIPRFS